MENNRRNGKIARLSKGVRDIVGQMLDDGATYDAIIEKLEELGHQNFNRVNIHKWKNGGYRDWQREQTLPIRLENLELLEERREHSDGAGLASMQLACQHFYKILLEFDPDALRRRLAQKPEYYFDLMLAYTRLVKNRISFETLIKDEARAQRWRERVARLHEERERRTGRIEKRPG